LFGKDPTLTGHLEHRLFQSPYTQVLPYAARCTVRAQRKQYSFHQGHLPEDGVASLFSTINLTDVKIFGKDKTIVADGCDMRMTRWQSECGGYFQMIVYLLPHKNLQIKSISMKSMNDNKRPQGTATNGGDGRGGDDGDSDGGRGSDGSGGSGESGGSGSGGGGRGGIQPVSSESSSSTSFEGLMYQSSSPDLDGKSPLDLLLEEFSVLDGDTGSHVEQFNASETPYVQDAGEIDRLMAETANNLYGRFYVGNSGKQSYRSGTL
jgi:hypothetical protein